MKTVWKWILGIIIVLVVAGLVVGAVFMWQHRPAFSMRSAPFAYRQYQQNAPNAPSTPNPQNNQSKPNTPNGTTPNRPMMPRGFGYGRGPMMGRGFGYSPMMGRGGFGYGSMMSRGFSPFFVGFSMMFGLVKLVLFGLLLYGAYWLGRRSVTPVVAPVAPVPVSDPEPAPQRGRRITKS